MAEFENLSNAEFYRRGTNEVLWLWLAYFIQAENFDRNHPGTWMSAQVWMPRGDFFLECRKHARQLRLETIDKINVIALKMRLKADDLKRAEQQAAGMYHNERVELANRLNVTIHCERIDEVWKFINEWPVLR